MKINKQVKKVIDHWNNKGKPLPCHRIAATKLILRAAKLIELNLRQYEIEEITKAIDVYFDLITAKDTTVTHIVPLDEFFKFSVYLQKQFNYELKIKSWFEECMKNEQYLKEKYGKYHKNKYPKITEHLKKAWIRRFKSYHESIQNENNFRIAAICLMDFLKDNSNKMIISQEKQLPNIFMKYVFDLLQAKKPIKKIHPGWLTRDFFWTEQLPQYLFGIRVIS